MRISLFLFTLLAFTRCDSQQSNKDFDWEAIESQMSNKDKRKLLGRIDDDIVKGFEQMAKDMGSDEVYDSFHVLDLNNDKQEDVIYNGFGGAADEFVMVFLNVNGSFKKNLHTYGHVVNLTKHKRRSEMIIYKPEMIGDESSDITSFYEITKDNIVNTKNQRGKIQVSR